MNDDFIYNREKISESVKLLDECQDSLVDLDIIAEKSYNTLSLVNGVLLLQQVDPTLFDNTLLDMLNYCKQNLDGLTNSILEGMHNIDEYLASLEQEAEEITDANYPNSEHNNEYDSEYDGNYGSSNGQPSATIPQSSSFDTTEQPSMEKEKMPDEGENSKIDNSLVEEMTDANSYTENVTEDTREVVQSVPESVEQPMVNPTPQVDISESVINEVEHIDGNAIEEIGQIEDSVIEEVSIPTEPTLISHVEHYRDSLQGSLGGIGVSTSKIGTVVKNNTDNTTNNHTTKRGLSPLATAIVGGGIGAISLGIAGISAYTMHKEEKEARMNSHPKTISVILPPESPKEEIKNRDYYSQFFDIPYDEDE